MPRRPRSLEQKLNDAIQQREKILNTYNGDRLSIIVGGQQYQNSKKDASKKQIYNDYRHLQRLEKRIKDLEKIINVDEDSNDKNNNSTPTASTSSQTASVSVSASSSSQRPTSSSLSPSSSQTASASTSSQTPTASTSSTNYLHDHELIEMCHCQCIFELHLI